MIPFLSLLPPDSLPFHHGRLSSELLSSAFGLLSYFDYTEKIRELQSKCFFFIYNSVLYFLRTFSSKFFLTDEAENGKVEKRRFLKTDKTVNFCHHAYK